MFPPLEYVADPVGGPTPVEFDSVDEIEEGDPVLGAFAPAGRESPWRDGERTQVRTLESAIDRAG